MPTAASASLFLVSIFYAVDPQILPLYKWIVENPDGRFSGVSWDVGGNRDHAQYDYLSGSRQIESLTLDSGGMTRYSYDAKTRQKLGVENSFGTTLVSRYQYTYDSIERRTSMTTSGQAFDLPAVPSPVEPGITSYTTNELNQYTRIEKDSQDSTLFYDDDGNLLQDGTFRYQWNAENRLISAEPVDSETTYRRVEFSYDYMGRRIMKSVYLCKPDDLFHSYLEKRTLFIYDGWDLIAEKIVTDNVPSSRYYVWGLDLSGSIQGAGGVGGLLAMLDQGGEYQYFYDANGNVGQMVDTGDGSVAAHYEYSPFGKIISKHGDLKDENPFHFSTKFQDDETGLSYYGLRYYSPELGRWINRDPIEEEGGLNLYSVTDGDSQTTIVLCAESGANPFGEPIPEGKYEILERAGRSGFFLLDAIDSKPRNDTHDSTGRTQFRLHKTGRTIGCIAAGKGYENCWENIVKLINSTSTIDVEATSHRRFEFIRGPAKETIKKYGELKVISVWKNHLQSWCFEG